jgi:hypothetical protein
MGIQYASLIRAYDNITKCNRAILKKLHVPHNIISLIAVINSQDTIIPDTLQELYAILVRSKEITITKKIMNPQFGKSPTIDIALQCAKYQTADCAEMIMMECLNMAMNDSQFARAQSLFHRFCSTIIRHNTAIVHYTFTPRICFDFQPHECRNTQIISCVANDAAIALMFAGLIHVHMAFYDL